MLCLFPLCCEQLLLPVDDIASTDYNPIRRKQMANPAIQKCSERWPDGWLGFYSPQDLDDLSCVIVDEYVCVVGAVQAGQLGEYRAHFETCQPVMEDLFKRPVRLINTSWGTEKIDFGYEDGMCGLDRSISGGYSLRKRADVCARQLSRVSGEPVESICSTDSLGIRYCVMMQESVVKSMVNYFKKIINQ